MQRHTIAIICHLPEKGPTACPRDTLVALGQIDNLRVLTRESKNVEARRRLAGLLANGKTARRLRRHHLIGGTTVRRDATQALPHHGPVVVRYM